MAEKKVIIVVVSVVAGLVLIIGLVASSLKKLNSFEVGLSYDKIWKKLGDKTKNEGLHTGPPGFEFIKFPSVFKTLDFGGVSCLNHDGVPIYLDVVFQYQVRASELRTVIMQFKDHEGYLDILKSTATASIHETCSMYNTTQFQSERGNFQEDLRSNIRQRFQDLKCDITDLQVNNIVRPSAYETAIRAKEAARENIKVAESERPILTTQAKTKLREAETQAQITIDRALSQARIVVNKAQTEAQAILTRYEQELTVYQNLMKSQAQGGLGLSPEAFLSYMATRTIVASEHPVYFGMKAPAKTNYFP